MRWAALLRGVNVGGNRKLPMADLRAFLEGLNFSGVKTLLASGNAVFETDEEDASRLEALLEREAKTIGLDTDFLLRSAADLDEVIGANPFPDAADDHPSHLLVVFYRQPFPKGLLKTIADTYSGPERLEAVGRELFIDYPDNIGESKLDRAMAKARFPKVATARNWNTVNKLRQMLG